MEALKQVYLEKCKQYTCSPIQPFLDDLDASEGSCLADLKLNGNSKRLFNNRVQPMQVYALCDTLSEDANVVVVDLSYNAINDLAAQALAALIKANRSIRFINLTGNSITAEGVTYLCKALSQPECELQVLSLAGNPLGDDGVMALATMLRSNKSLRALDICDVNAGVKGLISMCSALGSESEEDVNTTLQALDIGAPVIHMQQDTVSLALARLLASNSSLVELGLSKHKMVDNQLETLVSYGLLRNSSLQSLDLRANRLSGFAAPQLEKILAECRSLVNLNLAANNLGDAGARAIAGCLPYTTWLTHLDLRNNNIGEQGLKSIAEVLGSAAQLRLLLLWGNAVGPAASKALREALLAAPQGISTAGGMLVTDITTYEVDGVAQAALLQVDVADVMEEEEAMEQEEQEDS